jgi:hypothetical protein
VLLTTKREQLSIHKPPLSSNMEKQPAEIKTEVIKGCKVYFLLKVLARSHFCCQHVKCVDLERAVLTAGVRVVFRPG